MSALQLPRRAPASTPAGERHLRLVEPQARSLAPSGPLQAWRRRLGVLLVLVALVVLTTRAFAGTATPAAPDMVPAAAATVVVEPGQTLWDIASVHAPADTGTWAYVDALAELNDVTAGELQAWQVLQLPDA